MFCHDPDKFAARATTVQVGGGAQCATMDGVGKGTYPMSEWWRYANFSSRCAAPARMDFGVVKKGLWVLLLQMRLVRVANTARPLSSR
jgi:hypothetical protein